MRFLLASLLVLSACDGEVFGGLLGSGRPDDPALPPPLPVETPGPSSRVPRLNHAEYENTVTDFLRLPAKPNLASTFVTDSTGSTFDTNGGLLSVDSTSWADYQRAAEQLAVTATQDQAALARTFGGTVPQGLEAQVRELARRAYRRPPTDAEVSALVTLGNRAATLSPTVPPALGGPRLVLEALLQSPHFLYRPELSDAVEKRVMPLSGHELANRLSYALWHTMPDDALFAAAASGELSTKEGVATQARRMLRDPRAQDTVASFHDQLLQLQKVFDVTRNTTLFPEFSTALRQSMAAEQRTFVRHVIFDQSQGLSTLLTAPYTFGDANVARVYGRAGVTGTTPMRLEFTDGRRGGLFTQLAFLTTNATSTETDPIHRGTFLNFRILCTGLPPPPNNVPPLPGEDPTMRRTMRDRIESFTGRGTCGEGCHSTFINPLGFAFEHYDALGRWREQDKGLPIDDSGEFLFDFSSDTKTRFEGGVALSREIAASQLAHGCYVEHWLEYLYGRPMAESERPLMERLGSLSRLDDVPVLRLVEELLVSDAFRARPVEVQP
ncbi:MAG: DUF1592 domain-containing protein [Myxococcaceae bacterium]|nr:DUF1592 domain-containing protein [Myxococcaceae bacterium]